MHQSLSDIILDIVQNAIEAGSRRTLLEINERDGSFAVVVSDTGKGMDEEELRKAGDPFYSDGIKHPGRRIGLGLPFLAQAAEQADGSFELSSRSGQGTVVSFAFDLANLDSPPVGDLAAAIRQAFAFDGDYELTVTRRLGAESWTVSRSQLHQALGDLETSASLALLDRYLRSQEEALRDSNTMEEAHG